MRTHMCLTPPEYVFDLQLFLQRCAVVCIFQSHSCRVEYKCNADKKVTTTIATTCKYTKNMPLLCRLCTALWESAAERVVVHFCLGNEAPLFSGLTFDDCSLQTVKAADCLLYFLTVSPFCSERLSAWEEYVNQSCFFWVHVSGREWALRE